MADPGLPSHDHQVLLQVVNVTVHGNAPFSQQALKL
jgi:hypothetical protein